MFDAEITGLEAAAARFFRSYEDHCSIPNSDTLLVLLEACHSLNDRMNKAIRQSFFSSDEFAALNALRNLFQHHHELLAQIKIFPILPEMPLYSDLAMMCLVPREVVERAINGERQHVNKTKIQSALKWYGGLVNMNPALFNFAVIVFEKCVEAKLMIDDAAWGRFAEVYNTESKAGQAHFVNGDIVCRSADVDTVLNSIYVKH